MTNLFDPTLWSISGFMLPALLGSLLIAILAAPFGCVVVWQRMAYFGDTLAHTALLGIALGLLVHLPPIAGIILVACAAALLLAQWQYEAHLSHDSMLGILSHGSLALALIILSLVPMRVDLLGLLMGDVLLINWQNIAWIAGLGSVALATLWRIWPALLAITLNRSLAVAEGIPVRRTHLLFLLMLAGIVAIVMQVAGVLLAASLLILPAAIARRYAHTPEQMALGAMIAAMAMVLSGFIAALLWNLPVGASIVVSGVVMIGLVRASIIYKPKR